MAQTEADVGRTYDELAALCLRQRILERQGRPDLSAALESGPQGKGKHLKALQRSLADEEEALQAYREYAARIGIGVTPTPRATARQVTAACPG
ncbi:MAG TPA: hypothetical protein VHI93_08400, partial [Candidatus Thermoplasmatota archaeon]|nr:hypothetical protein [Candidatus Thermoplasmatota archaeon]